MFSPVPHFQCYVLDFPGSSGGGYEQVSADHLLFNLFDLVRRQLSFTLTSSARTDHIPDDISVSNKNPYPYK